MTSDDLKRIFLGPTLFRLDTLLSPRLVPVLYGDPDGEELCHYFLDEAAVRAYVAGLVAAPA